MGSIVIGIFIFIVIAAAITSWREGQHADQIDDTPWTYRK